MEKERGIEAWKWLVVLYRTGDRLPQPLGGSPKFNKDPVCGTERQLGSCAVAQVTRMCRRGTQTATRAVWDSWGKRRARTAAVGLCDMLEAN